jgi:fibronectin type 3 domain-containing protein
MYPETTPDEIEEILTKTATDLGTPGKDIYTGSGLLNVGLAVQTLKTRRLSKTYPQKAAVKCVDYQAAKLGWDAVPWAERYVIFRSTSVNGEYTKIKSIHALDWYTYTSSFGRYRFTDKGLATGTTYYYKIRAVCAYQSGFSHSQYCPVISIKCTLNAPTGLTLTPTTGKMKVSWAKVNGAEGYQIWRADTKTGTYKRIHTLTSGATVSYDDTTVKAGKTYYYKIRAYRKPNGTAVFSEYSGIVGKKSI